MSAAREVKQVSDERIMRLAKDFMAAGLERATVNVTRDFDLEPVDAWHRGGALMHKYGLPVDVVVEGDRVVFVRRTR